MISHLTQVKHNEDFLAIIENHCPQTYFDWKVTVVFYSGLHYLRGLEKLRKLDIGIKHKDLFYHINPNKKDALMPVDQAVYDCYSDLFNLSISSRYDGIDDKEARLRGQT